jgi:hypothetical protein
MHFQDVVSLWFESPQTILRIFDWLLMHFFLVLQYASCPHPSYLIETNCIYQYNITLVSRLALHGESIGGLCACQAAAHPTCKDLVDLLIVDRTFANLGAVH